MSVLADIGMASGLIRYRDSNQGSLTIRLADNFTPDCQDNAGHCETDKLEN